MAVLYKKKKILKAQAGSVITDALLNTASSSLSSILSGNKTQADAPTQNVTDSLVSGAVQGIASGIMGGGSESGGGSGLGNIVKSAFGSGGGGGGGLNAASVTGLAGQGANMLIDAITGNYEKQMGGRYDLANTGVNSEGAQSISSALNTASQFVGQGVGAPLLHGASEIIAGANQKKEANAVNQQYGMNYKAYNGTGVGKVAGGAVEAVAGTLLNVFGVSGDTANVIAGTLGKGVNAAVGIFGDSSAKGKRMKEQNRMMNNITNIKQDQALGDSFERYATKMPHYDKYSNVRYARKGGIIYSRLCDHDVPSFASGGAVILGGQRHSQEGEYGKGNPIYQDGKKVAETEREELLLSKEQTVAIEEQARLFEETGDEKHLAKLGDLMKGFIKFQTEDQSGKYKELNA